MGKILILALLLSACGVDEKNDLSEMKIVGGYKTYQQFYGKVGGCGSALIAPRWAVSASHCFKNGHPSHVTFGLFKRSDSYNEGRAKDKVAIKRVVKHPSWDLALIELKRASKFKPMKMHEGRDPPDGYRLQTYGFGNTYWQSGAPDILQGTVLVFNEKATKNARPQIIRAGETGKAVCHGDSGGPLMYNVLTNESATTKLLAVTTFTVGKCKPGALMGFTRLDHDWIRKIMKRI